MLDHPIPIRAPGPRPLPGPPYTMTAAEQEAYARIRAAYRLGLPIVVERIDGAVGPMQVGDRVSNVVRIMSAGIERKGPLGAEEVFTPLVAREVCPFDSGFVQRVFDACPYNPTAYRRHVDELENIRLRYKLSEGVLQRNDPALRERLTATMSAFLKQQYAATHEGADPNDLDVIDLPPR